MNPVALAFAILSSLLTTSAWAACPGDYSGLACLGACTFSDSPHDAVCDFSDVAGTNGAAAKFVTPASTQFRAYGTDEFGDSFCCEHTFPDATYALTVEGTAFGDDFELADISESNTSIGGMETP